jgi:cation diffusion facilitator family transporter
LIAVIMASRPADRGHPYGHGKIEFFSAAFEGGLVSLASALILYEAALTLWRGPQLHNLDRGIWLNFAAGSLNGILGLLLLRAGKNLNSHALRADGRHLLSDFQVTLGLAAGLFAVHLTGLKWIDPLLAMGIGLLLTRTGWKLVRESFDALLDSEDPQLIGNLVEVINRVRPADIITVHELRAMRAGRYVHVDMHVVVPEFYEVGNGHDLVEEFGKRVIEAAALEGECHTHTDPCRQLYCERCRVEPCPIRRVGFLEKMELTPGLATSITDEN